MPRVDDSQRHPPNGSDDDNDGQSSPPPSHIKLPSFIRRRPCRVPHRKSTKNQQQGKNKDGEEPQNHESISLSILKEKRKEMEDLWMTQIVNFCTEYHAMKSLYSLTGSTSTSTSFIPTGDLSATESSSSLYILPNSTNSAINTVIRAVGEYNKAQIDEWVHNLLRMDDEADITVIEDIEGKKDAFTDALQLGHIQDETALSDAKFTKWYELLCRKPEQHTEPRLNVSCPTTSSDNEMQLLITVFHDIDKDMIQTAPNNDLGWLRRRLSWALTGFFAIETIKPYRNKYDSQLALILLTWILQHYGIPLLPQLYQSHEERKEFMVAMENTRRNIRHAQSVKGNSLDWRILLDRPDLLAPLLRLLLKRLSNFVDRLSLFVQEKSRIGVEEAEAKTIRRSRELQVMEATCMICLDCTPNMATLCCGRPVHFHCLAKWFKSGQHQSCPNCRKEFDTFPPECPSATTTTTIRGIDPNGAGYPDEVSSDESSSRWSDEPRDSLEGHRSAIASSRNSLEGRRSAIASSRNSLEGRRSAIASSRNSLEGHRSAIASWTNHGNHGYYSDGVSIHSGDDPFLHHRPEDNIEEEIRLAQFFERNNPEHDDSESSTSLSSSSSSSSSSTTTTVLNRREVTFYRGGGLYPVDYPRLSGDEDYSFLPTNRPVEFIGYDIVSVITGDDTAVYENDDSESSTSSSSSSSASSTSTTSTIAVPNGRGIISNQNGDDSLSVVNHIDRVIGENNDGGIFIFSDVSTSSSSSSSSSGGSSSTDSSDDGGRRYSF